MKKRAIAAAAALIVFALLLSACASEPPKTESPAPTATPGAQSPAPSVPPEVTPTVPPETPAPSAPPAVEPTITLPTVEPSPFSPTTVPTTPIPTPARPTPPQASAPDFPPPFSELAPSEFDPVFGGKLQELINYYPMGVQYAIFDIDGDGENELVTNKIGAQFNTLSIFEKTGEECVLAARGDRFYIDGKGRLVAHTGFVSDGCYHLYTIASPENPLLEYRSSLGLTRVSSDDSVYYLIDDRTENYIDISSYYDGRYNEQLIIYEWGTGSSPIDLSPYLIDESEYRSLLDELLDGCSEFDMLPYEYYHYFPAREFSHSDKPGRISIDYADDDFLVFHGNFGLFVYNFKSDSITASFDTRYYLRNPIVSYSKAQSADGSEHLVLQLDSYLGGTSLRAYHLDLHTGLCSIEEYDTRFEPFVTQSDGSVLFDEGTRGEILCDESGTIGGLYFTRGGDRHYLFKT